MSDWYYSTPHAAAKPPYSLQQNLDYGHTVPLTHAPMIIHQDQFTSVTSGYNTSAGNQYYGKGALPKSAYPISDKSRQERQRKGNTPEKKRLQTADFRWMFTKRKGIN